MEVSSTNNSKPEQVIEQPGESVLESNAKPERPKSHFFPSFSTLLNNLKSGTGSLSVLLVNLLCSVYFAEEIIAGANKLIKDTENTALNSFSLEQQKFIQQQSAEQIVAQSVPPWTGCKDEYSVKRQCLSLSSVEDNLLREPPAGCDFSFDFSAYLPQAFGALEADPKLQQLRFTLVPKKISEETFWRNYFFRVSLIRKAAEREEVAAGENSGTFSFV
ncbi:synapse associated protein 1 [Trichuris trichiura]|uniref:Synapse associated protein 1 n=1 Tax=Trichuris trichiura TaxID=36087 RepID=A0A077ZM67_TRITR|nr:synapse associated protein 1 [Trichuris trichiura]